MPVEVRIKVIRPTPHYFDPLFQICSLVNIGCADAISLLMAHLFFNGFFRHKPHSLSALHAIAQKPWPQTSLLVVYHAQRLVNGIIAHVIILTVCAGENKRQMTEEHLDRDGLFG